MTPAELARRALAIDSEAQRLLDHGIQGVPAQALLKPALAIRTLAGELEGWFVPVVVADLLVAFMRFTRLGLLKSSSSFMQRPGDFGSCPRVADWLDPGQIRTQAEVLCAAGEIPGEPMLSFDGAPDRLAWAVPLHRNGAAPHWVFVAGTNAWPAGL